MVRNIQPMCSNLGHSWQGRFFFCKSFKTFKLQNQYLIFTVIDQMVQDRQSKLERDLLQCMHGAERQYSHIPQLKRSRITVILIVGFLRDIE